MADTAVKAAKLPPSDALAFLRQKVPMPAATWTELWQEAHSVSFAVAGATSQALANDFHSAVLRTKEAGGTRREFQKEFDAIVARHGWEHTGTPGRRAAIIYDTNITTAYSAGRYRRQTTPEAVALYPYWRYRHHQCQHPRPQHMAWDGMILRWDDPFWNTHYPPNGWRCHCTVEVVSQRMLDRNGWEVSDSPIIETRPWRNPHTGEIVHVPVGIDPGFAYNPGKAWLMNEGARVVTTPTPKLRPAFAPAQDVGPARKARTAPTTTPLPPEKPPVAPKAPDVAQAPKPVATEPVPEAADDLKAQQDAVADLLHHPVGMVDAGTMPDDLRKALGSDARSVKLSGATVEKQLERHKDLSLADYLHVPEVIANPQLVVRESATHMRLFRNVGRIYRVVIKRTQDGSENFVVSCHVSRPHSVRQAIAGLEIMQGSLDDLLSGKE